jgi:hypothetical protein
MILFVKTQGDKDEDKGRSYHCAGCGAFITGSEAMVPVNGSREHSFVNPAGIQCDFITFLFCDNVIVDRELYIRHSWFPGYGWRFLVCSECHRHLGWKFDAVRAGTEPTGFFGVLVHSVDEAPKNS